MNICTLEQNAAKAALRSAAVHLEHAARDEHSILVAVGERRIPIPPVFIAVAAKLWRIQLEAELIAAGVDVPAVPPGPALRELTDLSPAPAAKRAALAVVDEDFAPHPFNPRRYP